MSEVRYEVRLGERILRVKLGDITKEVVDAIVNAANENLIHGGGLARAIVKAGGEIIQEESLKIAPVPTGSAKPTTAGRLSAKMVIHAVGPIWGNYSPEEADRLLGSAVTTSLKIATDEGLSSISIPAISSGIFGFPKDRCAKVIIEAVIKFFEENPQSSLKEINFCNFDEPTVTVFEKELKERFKKER